MSEFLNQAASWLVTPFSGNAHHVIAMTVAWHGRLMVLSWVILAPIGIGVARYYKVTPRQDWPRELDNRAWWHAHRAIQYAAVAAMTGGLAAILGHATLTSSEARLHAACGWVLLALGWLQIAAAMMRGSKGGPTDSKVSFKPGFPSGDHYDMTSRRRLFEYVHKVGGHLALLLSVFVVFMGLQTADAPRWMWLVIGAWWLSASIGVVVLQRLGRCIDTYQAIWGPLDDHPGNRQRPIGWGVRRPVAEQSKPTGMT